LTLDRIAADLCYSKNYLCKICKSGSGFIINGYVNLLRISKAYDLVCCTNHRLTEISQQCGFSSIHYFSRTFHRIVGMTPSQARDQEQNSLYTDIRLHGSFQYRYHKTAETAHAPGE
ncbi:MAG: helix-turn-helix transcriptional regulator, partial [Oscillibacter sp.]|nr:helix-turn-helix transcriptional regulator [Oscillibacter sp.]